MEHRGWGGGDVGRKEGERVEEEVQTEELSGLCTKRACSGGHSLSHCQPGVNNLSSLSYPMTLLLQGVSLLQHILARPLTAFGKLL